MTPTGEIREDTGDGAAVALTTPDRGGTPTAPVAGPGSAGGSRRRTWALLAFDSRTGCATAVVAFAGIEYPGGPAARRPCPGSPSSAQPIKAGVSVSPPIRHAVWVGCWNGRRPMSVGSARM
jgi:hypothetical protein